MSKTSRLIELMLFLSDRHKFTVSELAEEFGVSYRTMLRDLDELSSLGVPLYSEVGVNGGYYMLQQRILPPIIFSVDEAVSMYFILQSLEYYGALPFNEDTKSALRKFFTYLPVEAKNQINQMKERLVFWNPNRSQSSEVLQQILDASISKKVITIYYEGKHGQQERAILPIGLYTYNGFWYCPAYCLLRMEYRLFRADRITFVTESNEGHRKIDIKSSVIEWIQPIKNDKTQPIKLIVTLDKEGVRRSTADLSLTHLVTKDNEGNGKIETTIPYSKVEYMTELIYSLGEHATILEPQMMIDSLKEKVKRLLANY